MLEVYHKLVVKTDKTLGRDEHFMIEYKLGEIEMQFADIIWQNEPLTSRELTILAEKELSWNRSTTYTILRKLCTKGIFKNEKAQVASLVSKKEYTAMQSERFVEDTFKGSLPSFLASFTTRKKLSDNEISEIMKIIDEHKEG